MEENKEILIQDVSDINEVELFEKYNLYRRDKTPKKPLYFAPYFTNNAVRETGINYLSKVLGVLTFRRLEFENIIDEIGTFTDDKIQKDNWIKGVQMESNFTLAEDEQTFYFLDKPMTFMNPLVKDFENSKGWIGKRIPKNRIVSFIDFLKHIPELMNSEK